MQMDFKTHASASGKAGSRGFTMIEVMVVVGMIAIMSTVAASRFGTLVGYEWRVRDAAQSLRSTIVLASTEARSHGRLVSVFLGSKDCTSGGDSDKFYSYLRSGVCTSVELPKDIYFGLPDAISVGPDTGTGEHGTGDGDGIAIPGNTLTYNTQGFLVFPLTIENDTIFLHYRQANTAGDPRYARAMTVAVLGRPSVYKWNMGDDSWLRVDRR